MWCVSHLLKPYSIFVQDGINIYIIILMENVPLYIAVFRSNLVSLKFGHKNTWKHLLPLTSNWHNSHHILFILMSLLHQGNCTALEDLGYSALVIWTKGWHGSGFSNLFPLPQKKISRKNWGKIPSRSTSGRITLGLQSRQSPGAQRALAKYLK